MIYISPTEPVVPNDGWKVPDPHDPYPQWFSLLTCRPFEKDLEESFIWLKNPYSDVTGISMMLFYAALLLFNHNKT